MTTRSSLSRTPSGRAALVASLSLALYVVAPARAHAAETDNYWAWRDPPRDSTYALERHLQREMKRALDSVNAWPGNQNKRCEQVVDDLLLPFSYTGVWFFVGTMERWGLRYTPRTNRQYLEEYLQAGVYRYADRPLPGALLPLDPSARIAGVHIGLDKIGHFLLNGRRYYDRYQQARARGLDEEAALVHAIELGLDQENGILGLGVSGIFSYADLEANYQGLELYRWMCEGPEPALRYRDDKWSLQEPLDIERFVNPCWDESYSPNAFGEALAPGVLRALGELCPLLETSAVQRLRASYRSRACTSFSHEYVSRLVRAGELPDPRPFDIEQVCHERDAPE